MKKASFKHYDLFLAASALSLLISNIAATKLIAVGPLILDGGAVLFPLAYIIGDVLTEVYGYRYARRAIWAAIAGLLVGVLVFSVVSILPYPDAYTSQEAYQAVLGFFPRIVIASILAFLVGEFLNSYVLAKLKVRDNGKHMWRRLLGSSVVGELFDTVTFCLVAFLGVLGGWDMVNYIVVGYLFKLAIEVVMLPVTYRIIMALKKSEGVDAYDTKTDFTPLSVSLTK